MTLIEQIDAAREKSASLYRIWKTSGAKADYWAWQQALEVENSLRSIYSLPSFCTELDWLMVEGQKSDEP